MISKKDLHEMLISVQKQLDDLTMRLCYMENIPAKEYSDELCRADTLGVETCPFTDYNGRTYYVGQVPIKEAVAQLYNYLGLHLAITKKESNITIEENEEE